MIQRLLGLGLIAVVLAGCGGRDAGVGETDEGQLVLGETEQTATVTRGVALGTRTLVLDGFRGNVVLRAATGDNTSLTFEKHARGRDDADAARLLERITLEEAGDAEAYRYTLRSGDANLSHVDVEGTVPPSTAVEIRLQSGAVRLSGIEGPLDVRVDNGTVEIGGAGQRVDVEVRNGSVEAGFFRLADGTGVNLRTTNGEVVLTLPASAPAAIEARTGAGDVRVEGLSFADRRLAPDGAGARFQGRLGAGSVPVALRTENGSITLREGTVLRLSDEQLDAPPPEAAPSAPPPTPMDSVLSDSARRNPAI